MSKIPSHYKLINEHPHSYELHDERDGRSFHVAKNQLDLAMHGKLSKIERYSKGGEAETSVPVPLPPGYGVNSEVAQQELSHALSGITDTIGTAGSALSAGIKQQDLSKAPEEVVAPPVSKPEIEVAPKANNSEEISSPPEQEIFNQSQYQKALQEEKATYQRANEAENVLGNKKAAIYEELANNLNSLKNPLEIEQEHKARQDELLEQYQKNIDPDRLIKNMTGGEKVNRIIGLVFGGLGAGKYGENPGYTLLEKDINRDIEAQKAAKETAYNLYKMNREATQDSISATLKTEEQMWSAVKAKILSAEGLASGPVAAAGRAQLLGNVDEKLAQIRMQTSLLQAARGSNVLEIDPTYYVNTMPKEYREHAVKEINKMKQLKSLKQGMMEAEEKLEQLYLAGTFSPEMRKTLIKPFAGTLVKLGEGSFTQQQAEDFVDSFLRSRLESGETTEQKARSFDNYTKALQEDSFFRTGTHGVGLDRFNSTRLPQRSDGVKLPESGKRVNINEVKSYIRENINSQDPRIKRRINFLINEYRIGR